jgi:hypothetical protein
MPQNVFEVDISRGIAGYIYPSKCNISSNRMTRIAIPLHTPGYKKDVYCIIGIWDEWVRLCPLLTIEQYPKGVCRFSFNVSTNVYS